jgi:hypothetical protein
MTIASTLAEYLLPAAFGGGAKPPPYNKLGRVQGTVETETVRLRDTDGGPILKTGEGYYALLERKEEPIGSCRPRLPSGNKTVEDGATDSSDATSLGGGVRRRTRGGSESSSASSGSVSVTAPLRLSPDGRTPSSESISSVESVESGK